VGHGWLVVVEGWEEVGGDLQGIFWARHDGR